MTNPDDLDPGDQASLDAILAACRELAAVTAHVRAFAAIMTSRRGRHLEQRMASAAATGEPALQSFVNSLRADQDAVTAGLTLQCSSGSAKDTSTASRCSSGRCTDGQTLTCSASASRSPTGLTETAPEPVFSRRRQVAWTTVADHQDRAAQRERHTSSWADDLIF